jgi:hypothetical protein
VFQIGDIVRTIPGQERSLVRSSFDTVAGKLYTVSEIRNTSLVFLEKPGDPAPVHNNTRFELVERPREIERTEKVKTKWTKEMIATEAQKYKKRSMFSRYSNTAYYAAVRMGILNEVCGHMPERSLTKKYAEAGKKVFVRYQNRKLYDVSASKYVNLSTVLSMPLGSFMVIDDKTKENITNFVLIQGVTAVLHENPASFESIKDVLVEKNILKGATPAV